MTWLVLGASLAEPRREPEPGSSWSQGSAGVRVAASPPETEVPVCDLWPQLPQRPTWASAVKGVSEAGSQGAVLPVPAD